MKKFDYIAYAVATNLITLIYSALVARGLTLEERGDWGIIFIYSSIAATLLFPPVLDYLANEIYEDKYLRGRVFEILMQLIAYLFFPISVVSCTLLRFIHYDYWLEIPLVALGMVLHSWIVGVFLQISRFRTLYIIQFISIIIQTSITLILFYTDNMNPRYLAVSYFIALTYQSIILLRRLKAFDKALDFSNPSYLRVFINKNIRKVILAYFALVSVILLDGFPKIYLSQQLSLAEFGKVIVILQFAFSSFGIVNSIFKSRVYALSANKSDEQYKSSKLFLLIFAIYFTGTIFALIIGKELVLWIFGAKFEVTKSVWASICGFALTASVLRLRFDYVRGQGRPNIEVLSFVSVLIFIFFMLILSRNIDTMNILLILNFMSLMNTTAFFVSWLFNKKVRK